MNGIIPERQKNGIRALSGYRDSALSLSFPANIIETPDRTAHTENQSVKNEESECVGHRTTRISRNPKNSIRLLPC